MLLYQLCPAAFGIIFVKLKIGDFSNLKEEGLSYRARPNKE